MARWLIIGAGQDVGLEFVRQILARGDKVVATVRSPEKAAELWKMAGVAGMGVCQLLLCDISTGKLIDDFITELMQFKGLEIFDYVVMNTSINHYPQRATEVSYDSFTHHLRINCAGPIILAQKLLHTGIPISTIVFISSDSGSATKFLEQEDGFAAYSASKAALHQAIRHMAAELKRKSCLTTLLAIYPGVVETGDTHEIDDFLTPEQSVNGMISTIIIRTPKESGSFWTWQGKQHPW